VLGAGAIAPVRAGIGTVRGASFGSRAPSARVVLRAIELVAESLAVAPTSKNDEEVGQEE
jgi:hypothetical protein